MTATSGVAGQLDRFSRTDAVLRGSLARFSPISLAELTARDAGLQTRVDRKYLMAADLLPALLEALDQDFDVLQIDGRRVCAYSTTYFDTPDLRSFHEHRQGRRHRFKVRTRTYLDSAECWLEVKTKTKHEDTHKVRQPHLGVNRNRLTPDGRRFVGEQFTGRERLDLERLEPTAVVGYQRSTLVAADGNARLTIDTALTASSLRAPLPAAGQQPRQVAASPRLLLVETKSANGADAADRALRNIGIRPQPVSKYCIMIAALHPDRRPNPWLRAHRAYFGAQPPAS